MEEAIKYIKTEKYDVVSRRMNIDGEFRLLIEQMTSYLDSESENIQRIYHIKNDIDHMPQCFACGDRVSFSRRGGSRKGYNKYCSHSCKTRHNNVNRTPEQARKRKEKIRQTCLDKYGVEHYFASKGVREKIKSVFLERYGVENPSQIESVKNKKEQTCLENYGVLNPSQSPKVQSKKTKTAKKKSVVAKNGKIFLLEGYENWAVQTLLEDHAEEDILVHKEIHREIGKIEYTFGTKKSVYHPDIYIKSKNKIIEVKSVYWYNRGLARNIKKKEACMSMGLDFEFWIYDKKAKSLLIK